MESFKFVVIESFKSSLKTLIFIFPVTFEYNKNE